MDLLNAALLFSAILIVASLSGLFSEKGGIVNIAINGLMIIGALSFQIFAAMMHGESHFYTFIFALLCAGVVTAIFSLIHGFATIVLKADHVVSGTAINLLAAGLGLFLTKVLAGHFAVNQGVDQLQRVYEIKYVGNDFYLMNIIYFALAVFIAITIYTYFKHMKLGIAHAAVGENPNAVDSAGLKVNGIKWWAVSVSGFLAGVAGSIAMQKIGTFNGNVQGLGFVALAIMILGQWRTWFIVFGAFAFAILYAVADKYVLESIPKDIMKMIPFVLSLLALVVMSKFQSAPKAVGLHFDKSKR